MKNNSNSNNILLLCQAALIAALYIVLTFLANAKKIQSKRQRRKIQRFKSIYGGGQSRRVRYHD